jgi:hypothetical protein
LRRCSPTQGLRITNSKNIKIGRWQHGNGFSQFGGGVYAMSSKSIVTQFNDFHDVHRDWTDTARGQFVQYNRVTGPDKSIHGNTGGNAVGSNPEDLISIQVRWDSGIAHRCQRKLLRFSAWRGDEQ